MSSIIWRSQRLTNQSHYLSKSLRSRILNTSKRPLLTLRQDSSWASKSRTRSLSILPSSVRFPASREQSRTSIVLLQNCPLSSRNWIAHWLSCASRLSLLRKFKPIRKSLGMASKFYRPWNKGSERSRILVSQTLSLLQSPQRSCLELTRRTHS